MKQISAILLALLVVSMLGCEQKIENDQLSNPILGTILKSAGNLQCGYLINLESSSEIDRYMFFSDNSPVLHRIHFYACSAERPNVKIWPYEVTRGWDCVIEGTEMSAYDIDTDKLAWGFFRQ